MDAEQEKSKKGILVEDSLIVKAIDAEGKKFKRVSRVHFHSERYGLDVLVDLHVLIFPIHIGNRYSWMLTRTLRYDGGRDPAFYNPEEKYLDRANDFQYVMYGQVYRIEDPVECDQKQIQTVYISYGGLLQRVQGDPSLMQEFEVEMDVYFLLKRKSTE